VCSPRRGACSACGHGTRSVGSASARRLTFTTITFLIFLAIVFPLYWSLRSARQQNVLLIVAGYIFYGWWDWRFCGLLLISSLVDFWAGHALERTDDERRRRRILAAALSTNLGILGVFKYFNFFADSFSTAAGAYLLGRGRAWLRSAERLYGRGPGHPHMPDALRAR
jgi:hypothetical protein